MNEVPTGMLAKIRRNTRKALPHMYYNKNMYSAILKKQYYERHIATIYSNAR